MTHADSCPVSGAVGRKAAREGEKDGGRAQNGGREDKRKERAAMSISDRPNLVFVKSPRRFRTQGCHTQTHSEQGAGGHRDKCGAHDLRTQFEFLSLFMYSCMYECTYVFMYVCLYVGMYV